MGRRIPSGGTRTRYSRVQSHWEWQSDDVICPSVRHMTILFGKSTTVCEIYCALFLALTAAKKVEKLTLLLGLHDFYKAFFLMDELLNAF